MALRLYLSNEARELVMQQRRIDVPGIKVRFKNIPICLDADGRPYYEVRNDQLPVSEITPPALREHVTCYSWLITLHRNCPTKTLGQYEYETATAKLDRTEDGQRIKANIQGPNLEHVHALYRQIRAGAASPCESWDWEEPEEKGESQVQPQESSTSSQDPANSPGEMIVFACGKCGTKHAIDMDKLAGEKRVNVRCLNCKCTILLQIPDSPPQTGGTGGMLN